MNQSTTAYPVSSPASRTDEAGSHSLGKTYVMQGRHSEKALNTYHLILAPTHACNLRCRHCYLPDHAGDLLPKNVALRLVDEWAKITLDERGRYGGIFHVKGGEPFVVRYLPNIVDRLIELKCLRLMMTTNGTHSRPKDLDLLSRAQIGLEGNMTVVVSLDGATAKTHDYLRGKGQFDRTISFLAYLQSTGIQTFLNCVLHEDNISEISDFLELAKEYSVSQVNFLPIVPKGFGKDLRCHQAPHTKVHKALTEIFMNSDAPTKTLLAGSLPDIITKEGTGEFSAAPECVAGYRGLFYIKPDGSAFTCPNLENIKYSIGNVKELSLFSLHDRLMRFRQFLRKDGHDDTYICTGERIQYEEEQDSENIESLNALKSRAENDRSRASSSQKRNKDLLMSFCVSRNW